MNRVIGLLSLLWMPVCANAWVGEHAPIVVDSDYYAQAGVLPPSVTESATGTGYKLTLVPCPIDMSGVSVNRFTHVDLTGYEELEVALPQGSNMGDNYGVVLDLNNTAARPYFTGLVRNLNSVGIPVAVESNLSMDLQGLELRGFQQAYFESKNSGTDMCLEGLTIRDYKGDDCPTIFVAEHYLLDGKLELDHNVVKVESDCDCDFSLNGNVTGLSGLETNCGQYFKNSGYIEVDGPIVGKIGGGVNRGHTYWAPWTDQMKNRWCTNDWRTTLCDGTMRLDEWQDYSWPEPPEGRNYEAQDFTKGVIKAKGINFIVGEGGFKNIDGGYISSTVTDGYKSHIIAEGVIENSCKKAMTEDGYDKTGYTFHPSRLEIDGPIVIHSSKSGIKNYGSTIRISGEKILAAGKSITNEGATGSYLLTYGGKIHTQKKGEDGHTIMHRVFSLATIGLEEMPTSLNGSKQYQSIITS